MRDLIAINVAGSVVEHASRRQVVGLISTKDIASVTWAIADAIIAAREESL